MKLNVKMPAGDDDDNEDEQNRDRQVWQDFSDHDLAPPE